MCTVSAVGDFYTHRWVSTVVPYPPQDSTSTWIVTNPAITREEFDALKAEVAEMKELLAAAKRIDDVTGQPDCEMGSKLAVLRKVAELVGIDLTDVIGS